MAHDDRSPEQIERDLAETRRHLESTLDALQDRMSPGSVFEDALSYVRRDGGAFGRNLVETVRDNPLPATLMTIGLGWMMVSGRNGRHQYGALVPAGDRQDHPTARERLHDTTDALRSGRDSAAERASGAAHAVGDSARRGWDSTRETVAGMSERTRDAVSGVGDRMRGAGECSRAAGRSMAGFFEENPLAVGVMALAAGAALAAFLPRTRTEDETLGPLRERALEEGRTRARAVADEAGERARVAAHAATHPEEHREAADKDRDKDRDKDKSTTAGSAGSTASSSPSSPTSPSSVASRQTQSSVRPDTPGGTAPARPSGAPPSAGSGTTPPRTP